MSTLDLTVTWHADVSGLTTDADFDRAAEELLPGVVAQIGGQLGELAWAGLSAAGGGGLPPRDEVVRATADDYRAQLTAADRQRLKETIVGRLREEKARGGG